MLRFLLAAVLTLLVTGQPAHAAPAACTATITIATQWPTGYTANLAVDAANWTVVAIYPDPVPTLGPAWNMTMAQDKNIAVFRPTPWNHSGGGFIGAGTTTTPDSITCLIV